MTHAVREAAADDAADVVHLLDAAVLSVDRDRVRRRVCDGDTLVAVVQAPDGAAGRASSDRDGNGDDRTDRTGRVVGACVLDRIPTTTEVDQVAVHRSRRGRGIGTALVEAAAARTDGPLVARFRPAVRPFYESLGFDIDAGDPQRQARDDPDRLRGVLR